MTWSKAVCPLGDTVYWWMVWWLISADPGPSCGVLWFWVDTSWKKLLYEECWKYKLIKWQHKAIFFEMFLDVKKKQEVTKKDDSFWPRKVLHDFWSFLSAARTSRPFLKHQTSKFVLDPETAVDKTFWMLKNLLRKIVWYDWKLKNSYYMDPVVGLFGQLLFPKSRMNFEAQLLGVKNDVRWV